MLLRYIPILQILLNYHIPILSPYVERVFDENVVWAGTALLINSGSICLSAPFLGNTVGAKDYAAISSHMQNPCLQLSEEHYNLIAH